MTEIPETAPGKTTGRRRPEEPREACSPQGDLRSAPPGGEDGLRGQAPDQSNPLSTCRSAKLS